MRNTYIYEPTWMEFMTRPNNLNLTRGTKLRLARKSPPLGKPLNRRFAWTEDLNGNFVGMITRESLIKLT